MDYKKIEKEIIEETKEFAKSHNIHYDEITESMILNAMRELFDKITEKKINKMELEEFLENELNGLALKKADWGHLTIEDDSRERTLLEAQELVKELPIHNVSQQRELLNDFFWKYLHTKKMYNDKVEPHNIIDDYLKGVLMKHNGYKYETAGIKRETLSAHHK